MTRNDFRAADKVDFDISYLLTYFIIPVSRCLPAV